MRARPGAGRSSLGLTSSPARRGTRPLQRRCGSAGGPCGGGASRRSAVRRPKNEHHAARSASPSVLPPHRFPSFYSSSLSSEYCCHGMCLLRIFTAVVQYCIMHAAILVLRNANSCLLAGILPIGFCQRLRVCGGGFLRERQKRNEDEERISFSRLDQRDAKQICEFLPFFLLGLR